VWLNQVSPNVVIPVSDSITNAYGTKSAFSCTHNSDLEKIGQFYLEIWAQYMGIYLFQDHLQIIH